MSIQKEHPTIMEYTRLGNTGLKVSRLALGCMSYGDAAAAWAHRWALDEDAAQPGYAAAPVTWHQPGLFRGDLGAPGGQELADLGSVVHTTNGTSGYRG